MIRLAAFLSPRSIALVGCPSDLSRPGARPLVYLKKHAYPGQITRREISTMPGEVRPLGRLRGFRGAPPTDVPALVDGIAGVARLAEMLGDRLTSLDVNPITVGPRGQGAFVVDLLLSCDPTDARVVVE